eukprot:11219331-Lingulodinium_polyedra.AAC.1
MRGEESSAMRVLSWVWQEQQVVGGVRCKYKWSRSQPYASSRCVGDSALQWCHLLWSLAGALAPVALEF